MSENSQQINETLSAESGNQNINELGSVQNLNSVNNNSVKRGRRKTRIGKVISNKMDKSIIVAIEGKIIHPIYKKYFKKTTKFMAHDQNNIASIGDIVKIMETRPLSARKRWRLVEIIEKVK